MMIKYADNTLAHLGHVDYTLAPSVHVVDVVRHSSGISGSSSGDKQVVNLCMRKKQ